MKKTFLIIGGSSGIGKKIVESLLNDNHKVYATSRSLIENEAVNSLIWDANMPDNTIFDTFVEPLDGIVYCPGTINLKPFHRLSLEDFKNDLQVNVLGAVSVIQANLPKLKLSSSSSIVMFSTVASSIGMGFHASIAASKSAIEGLTLSLAAEFAPHKIRVNCIAPSLTDTPLASNLLGSDEKKDNASKRHPLGRIGTADEIAQLAYFLLSENASWITGQVLKIDGGLSAIK
ncbi:MAG: SDR family oxidoreductase [Pseudarcicella sp.]|nr:SDR family oxidoreductase [Pseudarcicella sp.]